MIIACLIATFLISNVAIVAGYYNTLLGIDWTAVKWVYESVPVLKVALILSLLLPLNSVIAFFTSKENYNTFKQELFALSFACPFFVLFLFLPGKLETPDNLQFNMTTMIILSVMPQLIFSSILAPRFWVMGGRDCDE